MKKISYIGAITIVIAGLVITSAASAVVQTFEAENKILNVEQLDLEASVLKTPNEKIVEKQPLIPDRSANPLTASLVWTTSTHNTVANEAGTVVSGFLLPEDPSNPGVYFTASSDYGVTFLQEAAGWVYGYIPDYPDVDTCHDGKFIGTMVPNYEESQGGLVYKMECSDPLDITNGYRLMYWDLSSLPSPPNTYHMTNMVSESVGGYAEEDPAYVDFAYGGTSVVADYQLNNNPMIYGIPVMVYSSDASSGWIHWFTSVTGATFTRMTIDPVTKKSFSITNEGTNGRMFYYKFNYDSWNAESQHPSAGSGHITTTSQERDVNFDIAAYNNSVIIVSERADGNVVAYYSSNGLSAVTEVAIASGASNPKVSIVKADYAKCAYVKTDGSVYFRQSTDGGATWTDETKVDEPENANIPQEYGVFDLCKIGGTWWSSSGGENNLYFAPVGSVPTEPILEIISIAGGIGVSATIKNTGNAVATNVDWTIHVTGGILGLINKTKTGTISTLDINAEETIKSGLILGLGSISIEVSATCDEGASVIQPDEGSVLFFIVRI